MRGAYSLLDRAVVARRDERLQVDLQGRAGRGGHAHPRRRGRLGLAEVAEHVSAAVGAGRVRIDHRRQVLGRDDVVPERGPGGRRQSRKRAPRELRVESEGRGVVVPAGVAAAEADHRLLAGVGDEGQLHAAVARPDDRGTAARQLVVPHALGIRQERLRPPHVPEPDAGRAPASRRPGFLCPSSTSTTSTPRRSARWSTGRGSASGTGSCRARRPGRFASSSRRRSPRDPGSSPRSRGSPSRCRCCG